MIRSLFILFLMSIGMTAPSIPSTAAEEFAMMDQNKDGKISANEHAVGTQQMWTIMDRNQDDKVTADEMTAAQPKSMVKEGEMSSAKKIAVIDSNQDSLLSKTEHGDGSKKMFLAMDTDKSGELSLLEVSRAHKVHLDKK